MCACISYTLRSREEAGTLDVIAHTFSVIGTPVFTLFDPGSTLSHICNDVLKGKGWKPLDTELDLVLSNPLGTYVVVNKVFMDVPLVIGGVEF